MKISNATIVSIFLLTLLTSCFKRIPEVSRANNLHHKGMQVEPYFEVKKKWLLPLSLFLGASTLGYYAGTQLAKGEDGMPPTTADHEEAGIALGMLAGSLVLVGIGSSALHNPGKTERVNKDNLKKWLKKYNKKHGEKYVIVGSDFRSVYIVPKNNKAAFIAEEVAKVRATRPFTAEEIVQGAIIILGGAVLIDEFINGGGSRSSGNEEGTCSLCDGKKWYGIDMHGNRKKCTNCNGTGKN